MAKFSRGSNISSQQTVTREQRQAQIAERNRQLRREKLEVYFRGGKIILGTLLFLIIFFFAQLVRFDANKIDEPYRASVKQYFEDNPLSKSLLFFNSESLNNYIINKHPEVKQFNMSPKFLAGANFEVIEKTAGFVWLTGDSVFLGDSDGVIYQQIDRSSMPTEMLKLKDGVNTGLQVNIGDQVTSSSTLTFISDLEQQLKDLGLSANYQIPSQAREIQVFLDGKPYYVKFNLDRSVKGQVSELQKVLLYVQSNNINVSQYVDLRVEDKAFYR